MRAATTDQRPTLRRRVALAVAVALGLGVLPIVVASPAAAAPAPATGSTSAQPVYATSGSGTYTDSIGWLSWGPERASVPNGASVTNWHAAGPNQWLEVTCGLTQLSGGTLSAYRPGTYNGDGLDELYGGVTSGLATGDRQTVGFTVDCGARLAQYAGPDRSSTLVGMRDVPLGGLVFADAESTSGSEWVEASADNGSSTSSPWRVLDRNDGGCTSTVNRVQATPTRAGNTWTLRLSHRDRECTTGAGTPNVVMLADGASRLTVRARGNGVSAVAIGYPLGLDYGDAPASYGVASGVVLPTWTGGGVPSPSWPSSSVDVAGYECSFSVFFVCVSYRTVSSVLATSAPPTVTLGADARANTVVPHSTNAAADTPDEDALAVAGAPVPAPAVYPQAAPYQATVRCRGGASAGVAGWIDWDADGTFSEGERSSVASCQNTSAAGGLATLTWAVPAGATSGSTFLRLRVSTDGADLVDPVGASLRGEVEDWAITVSVAQLSVTRSADHASLPGPGGVVTHTVRLTNSGTVPFTTQQPAHVYDDVTHAVDDAVVGAVTAQPAAPAPTSTGSRIAWSGPLAPGASVVLTYPTTMRAQPADRIMTLVSRASLTPVPPTQPVVCEAGSADLTAQRCARTELWAVGVDVVKSAYVNGTPAPSGAVLAPATEVEWRYTVTNTGSAPLTGVRLNDSWTETRRAADGVTASTSGAPVITCDGLPSGAEVVIPRLEAGASTLCTASGVVVPHP